MKHGLIQGTELKKNGSIWRLWKIHSAQSTITEPLDVQKIQLAEESDL